MIRKSIGHFITLPRTKQGYAGVSCAVLLSGFLPATGSLVIHTYVGEWRWSSEPFHAAVEAVGAFAALTLGILFILLGKGATFYLTLGGGTASEQQEA